jgi:gamma-glutamyltranspeptidase/glutathione hydrolase
MDRMHRAHGALPWARLFDPAVSIAEQGHPTSASTAGTLEREADALNRFPASRGVLLKPDGAPLREGELLVQKELAQTLKSIAEHGSDWFYVGEFAKRTCDYLTSIGGVLTASDFARYQALDRSPLAIQYRGYSVIGFPPPSSGGMHIAQMLGMLNPFPVSDTFRSSTVDGYHLIAECMKRAFADRAYWLGDSDFVKIPYGLMDSEYLRLRMTDYSLDRATEGIEHGVPQGIDPLWNPTAENPAPAEDRKHTTHLTVADASGNWVAMTCTVNTSWGSKVMVPGTGVVLNNQMDDFSLAPGTPNAFGLVGSVANAVAPGKRPLSSMSPTLVLDEDQRPCVTCGAAGGPRIISATLQILVRTLDLNQSIPDAIAGTRIHHQWRPDSLAAEIQPHNDDPFGITTSIMEKLTLRGHSIKRHEVIGIAQGIERRGDQLIAAHDPRTHGSSAS